MLSAARCPMPLVVLESLAFALPAGAAAPRDTVFSDAANRVLPEDRAGTMQPGSYRVLSVDLSALESRLAEAPLEGVPQSERPPVVVALPLPGGGTSRFHVWESPILEPGLAAQLPQIRTYRGQGLDDPTATVRLDLTDGLLHAILLTAGGTVYIDPLYPGDRSFVVSYTRRGFARKQATPFRCEAPDELADSVVTALSNVSSGGVRRTYRLAVAATGEYTAATGGTVTAALSAIATTVNRVNAVFERELAVRLVLVNGDAAVIYTDPATDPYTNGDPTALPAQNQATLDAVIGPANYDVGQVFGTGPGGAATVGVACAAGAKARGASGLQSPSGDPFDVDVVAHELGHQFGAHHTFNGTTGACGNGARVAATAYEPGSGSTIMSYAGRCGAEDLQPHADAYFHSQSWDEIVTYLLTTTCAAQTATGDLPPMVNAGPAHVIPRGTPFTLTATGSDPEGDAVTFAWEETDLGTASPPAGDDGSRPLFRSFPPSASSARTFPRLPDLLSGTTSPGETLPQTARTLNFRVTARDNRSGGGALDYASTTVAVDPSAGPFQVTVPNLASTTWQAGSRQPVRWNEAATASPPVSCAKVDILLSTDGGNNFDTVLLTGVENVSSPSVVVPDLPTSRARVKVACSDSIFFDISDADFTILGSGTTCTSGGTTLCLNAGRFMVTVAYRNQYAGGTPGNGQAVGITADTGYFWFFGPANVELIVKVLDGRAVNGKFWVFFGALSDLEYTLTITDTVTGVSKPYYNPPGTLASVADTNAF